MPSGLNSGARYKVWTILRLPNIYTWITLTPRLVGVKPARFVPKDQLGHQIEQEALLQMHAA